VFELIPAIDVLEGNVVRLHQGDYEQVTVYASDPVATATEFVSAGAPIVHVVDLEGARRGEPNSGLRKSLAAAGVRFQIGGGLRNSAAVEAAVADGAARAVVGTTAVWDGDEVERMIAAVGTDRLVGAVDVSGGRALGAGWLDDGQPLVDVLAALAAAGLLRVLVTAIVRDGTMAGPDLLLLKAVRESGLDVIASGGIAEISDLAAVADAGASGAIVGRALYEGRFTVAEAMAAVS